MKKMDLDKDGKISPDDFLATVKKEPLLLEAFGQCLPDENTVNQFITQFFTKE